MTLSEPEKRMVACVRIELGAPAAAELECVLSGSIKELPRDGAARGHIQRIRSIANEISLALPPLS